MGRTLPSFFFLTLCSCADVRDEPNVSKADAGLPKRAQGFPYLSFIVNQLKLSRVRHPDLRPDRHPNAGVDPHEVALGLENKPVSGSEELHNVKFEKFNLVNGVISCLTLLKCSIAEM